jgi:hypothetical protein
MALSGVYTFSVTVTDIIREAMLNCGQLGEAEVPTAQEFNDCQRKLNLMVKQWMGTLDFAPGLKMWTRARADLFLSSTKYQYALGPSGDNWAAGVTAIAGANYGQDQLNANAAASATTLSFGVGSTSNFTANDFLVVQLNSGDIYSTTVSSVNAGAGTIAIPGPGLPSAAGTNNYVWNFTTKGQRPLQIVTALLRDIQSNDTPLNELTLQDYEILPSKTQTGFLSDPTAYYYESQFASGTAINANGQLYIDVAGAQDVTKRVHAVYLKPVMDVVNPGDNPEYPQQWYRALCWGLTREICPMFDAEWTTDMGLNYGEAMAMAREADAEKTSFYFQPNADTPFSP